MTEPHRRSPSPSLWQDQFDRIPDSLVLTILAKLADVRFLGRCSAVSKRFRSLVSFVHDVRIKLDSVITFTGDDSPTTPRTLNLILSAIFKPLLDRITNRPLPRYSPSQVLNNFSHLRHLIIEFPSTDTEEGVFFKWRAKLEGTPISCIVLAGIQTPAATLRPVNALLKGPSEWASLALESVTKRFKLVAQIVLELPTLRSLALPDVDGQGELIIEIEPLMEVPNRVGEATLSSSAQDSVELRYASYVELTDGKGIERAVLVTLNLLAARESLLEAFDRPSRAAVKAMLRLPNILQIGDTLIDLEEERSEDASFLLELLNDGAVIVAISRISVSCSSYDSIELGKLLSEEDVGVT